MRYAAVFALTATLLAACNPSPTNTAPTVTLAASPTTIAPGASSTLTATVVKGTGDVKKVEFFEGTTLISSDDTAPYTATYSTTAATTLGDKSLTAKATDSNSLVGTSTAVKVTVAAPTPPSGILTAPATALVGLEVTLSTTAVPASGAAISSVEFFDGTTSLGKSTSTTSPYSLKTTFITAGAKSITAKITDDKGGVFTTLVSTTTVGASARVRAVHASSDAPNVDVQVDGTPVPALTNVPFGAFSPYLVLPAKTTNVKVFVTTTTATPVIAADLPLAAGKDYTVLAVGKATATPATIGALVLTDDNTAPTAGKAKVRVIHAASSVPAVDVYASAVSAAPAAPALFPNLTFNNTVAGAYPYKEVDPGTYKISVFAKDANPATATAAITVNTPALVAGKIYTAIALDPKAPATAPTVIFLADN